MFKKSLIALVAALALNAQAETVTFAIGEWEPYTGETAPDYGLSSKIISTACEKAGLTCEYEFMPWKRAYNMAMKGAVIGTFPWSAEEKERQDKFYPSKESVSSTETVFFYKDIEFPADAIKDFNKLNGLPLIGINGYTNSEKIKEMGIKIHMVNDSKLAWKMIEKGRGKILPDDVLVGKAECKKHTPSICDSMKTSEPIRSSPMHILFSRVVDNSEAVREKLDAALAEMKKSGEFDKILSGK